MIKTTSVDYECSKCGAEAWLEDGELEFGDEPDNEPDYEELYDEKPDCCLTCGGNYPDCMDSCDIFDD